jgi:hypothetical protein
MIIPATQSFQEVEIDPHLPFLDGMKMELTTAQI